jgi:hypothetical protein
LYTNYAALARGTGYADKVSDSQWQVFHERTALAKQTLLEAAHLKERDPQWYSVLQIVAHQEGWDRAHARDLLDQAVQFEPGYYHYYRNYANYLMPQWYGQPGDIQLFAEEVSAHLTEPESSIVYFQIVSSLSCYCRQDLEDLPHINYPKTRMGYENLTSRYGADNLIANRFAFMASTFKDQPAAHEAFVDITEMDLSIWYNKDIFDSARSWAGAP